jgi:hypothetical protein
MCGMRQPHRGEIDEPRAAPGDVGPPNALSPERAPQTTAHAMTRPFRALLVFLNVFTPGAARGSHKVRPVGAGGDDVTMTGLTG